MGNQILAQAAKDAGAKIMFGYPITPSSEILETWTQFCEENQELKVLQTEDEMAAGFGVIGACLAGVPAFTASAGPGNVLMQDAFSMAEALRIPTVAMITQRGGLSTSTVIYSQEEVTLTCLGGNGEGFRLVYSTANLQELYDYTLKAFSVAWQYRFPTFILADGYQAKMKGEVNINSKLKPSSRAFGPSSCRGAQVEGTQNSKLYEPILKPGVNLRNCYNLEEEIGEIITHYHQDFQKVRSQIEESESFQTEDAQVVIVAHGIVASAVKAAVKLARLRGIKAGLFRPITLSPFPTDSAIKALKANPTIVVIESALGQLSRLFKEAIYGVNLPLIEVFKPAVGFTPEEIVQNIAEIQKE